MFLDIDTYGYTDFSNNDDFPIEWHYDTDINLLSDKIIIFYDSMEMDFIFLLNKENIYHPERFLIYRASSIVNSDLSHPDKKLLYGYIDNEWIDILYRTENDEAFPKDKRLYFDIIMQARDFLQENYYHEDFFKCYLIDFFDIIEKHIFERSV